MATDSLMSLILAHRAEMTPQHGRIADYVCAHPVQTATMGIEELAAAAGVSVATVNRFVRALGLDGFAVFRGLAVAGFRRLMTPVEKIEAQAEHAGDDDAIVVASLESAIDDLRTARADVDIATWRRAAEAIATADHVVFVGFGLAAALVDLFADMIAPFCRAEIVLDGHGGPERVIRRTLRVGHGDLVIAVTLPRYSIATLEHARTMRAQGATILGISDAATSPLTAIADLMLFASAQHPLLHASATATVGVFEALAALLTARRHSAGEAAELTRRILPHLYDEDGAIAASGATRTSP